ncbi:MAG: TetR family transcriptional regulator C-terminal domain-containing protein [Aquabacterium sp.]|nr:TetR family transcriptional regulator C-terminal domain-containing protein [Aquabacterium sp.]
MPRTAHKTDTPHRLTEAGYSLFSLQGYNATGIQQITDLAGVPKGSFYNHFESKEVFAEQIIRNYATLVDSVWLSSMQEAPNDALLAIRQLFKNFTQHHEDAGCQGCLVGNFAAEVSESSPACRAALASVLCAWHHRLADLISQAQTAGSVRADISAQTLSAFFWDAWQGALLRTKIEHSTRPLKDVVATMLNTLFATPSPNRTTVDNL